MPMVGWLVGRLVGSLAGLGLFFMQHLTLVCAFPLIVIKNKSLINNSFVGGWHHLTTELNSSAEATRYVTYMYE